MLRQPSVGGLTERQLRAREVALRGSPSSAIPGDTARVNGSVAAEDVALLEGADLIVPQPPLSPEQEVSVAVWRDGGIGAILSIWHDPDDDEEPFAQDITVFTLVEGSWTWWSTGGSDWPVAYGERPPLERPSHGLLLRSTLARWPGGHLAE